jgi:hypothetical protein
MDDSLTYSSIAMHVSRNLLRHTSFPASSGIGRAASLAFAKAGMNVFMIDVSLYRSLSFHSAILLKMNLTVIN